MNLNLYSSLTEHEGIAALEGDREISYRELIQDVEKKTSVFSNLNRSSLVILLADNSYSTLVCYLALLKENVKFILLPHENGDDAPFTPFVRELCGAYKISSLIYEGRIMQYGAPFNEPESFISEELALLLTTSGSVGNSKLVKITYSNLLENARSICSYLNLTDADRAITSLPFNYSYGLSVINSLLLSGGSLALTNANIFEKEFWDVLSKGVTHFAGVPFSYSMLEKLRFRRKLSAYPSLRVLTQAGGHLDAELVKAYAESAIESNKQFFVMYGQTEATARMSYLPYNLAPEHPDSIGIAIPNGRFSILTDTGALTDECNITGEIVYQGPNVMAGYASSCSDLKTLNTPEYLHTGDIGCFDENGLLYIRGRKKRIIKITGHRISLDSVQNDLKLKGCDAVAIGKDESLMILLKEGSKSVVEDYMHNVIKIYKSYDVAEVDDYIYTSNGKIDYKSLHAKYLS